MAGSRVRACVNVAVDAVKVDADLVSIVGAGTKVATHIPQDTDPPYVLVMGGDEVPWAEHMEATYDGSPDSGDSAGRQVDVICQCTSTNRGSSQVDAMADRVMTVLLDDSIWNGLSGFQRVQFVRNQGIPPSDPNNDGTLWFIRLVTVRVTLG